MAYSYSFQHLFIVLFSRILYFIISNIIQIYDVYVGCPIQMSKKHICKKNWKIAVWCYISWSRMNLKYEKE